MPYRLDDLLVIYCTQENRSMIMANNYLWLWSKILKYLWSWTGVNKWLWIVIKEGGFFHDDDGKK